MAGKRGNSEGSITKRPDGLWEARLTLPNGKRKSLYAKTRLEAARKSAEAIRDRDKGLPVVSERQTVEQYFTSWLTVMRARIHSTRRNVSDLVDPPSRDRREMVVLSPEQARLLLAAAVGNRLEALYVLALTTGMREGELLALRWTDVDLDAGALQIRATLHHTTSGFVFSEPKTTHSRRRVALPKIAVEALKRHRVRQAEERLALGATWQSDYGLVFPNTIGGPIDDSHFRRREFAVLLKVAGLPHVRFHDLRHTAATLLFAQRVNAKVVSEMLGHSGIAITLGLYGHVTPPMQQAATEAMDEVFEQKG